MTKIEDKAENYEWWICRHPDGTYSLYRSLAPPVRKSVGRWHLPYPAGDDSSGGNLGVCMGKAVVGPLQPGGGPIKVKLVLDEET